MSKPKIGRPPETINPVRVSVRFSAVDYDRLDQLATRLGRSVPRLVRQAGLSALRNTPMAGTSAQ